ncbi:MAG TPA: FlgD immunoglobulin-like domain containing protein, partial [Candidatus Cloacimonadota bacterium]|nr:FlgD immunoglobulin-like domain containing protein [Candidatus Cloacimonadota bacterium]
NAGSHQLVWNGKDDNGRQVSSGLYFFRMKSGTYSSTRKMIMMK